MHAKCINFSSLFLAMIEIDGSFGEGGGQILRMSVALSALTKKPVKVFNIRANRPNPGLRRQHMVALEAVAKICNARVNGLKIGSKVIEFFPGNLKGGEYEFDIGTAGSITLVLQACLLPSLFAERETKLKLRGGTDVKWSPPWDYFQNVTLPLLEKMGAYVDSYLDRRGYYPVGGGRAEVIIEPCDEIDAIDFSGKVEKIFGIINIANLPNNIAERIKKSAEDELAKEGMKANIMIEETEAECAGVGIVLWTKPKILGADSLGEKGKKAEDVGKEAANKLIEEIKTNVDVDERAVDQLLPYMAIANGETIFTCRKISKHASTEMWLIKKFLDVEFNIEKNEICKVRVIPKG